MSFPQNGPYVNGTVNPAMLNLAQHPAATNVNANQGPPLFGPYASLHPTFDLNGTADGLYERNRKFSAPPNDDVDSISDNAEHHVRLVRAAITSFPAATTETEFQADKRRRFVGKMMQISDRDVIVTQVAAEIVRSVIALHTAVSEGVDSELGMVEDGLGNFAEIPLRIGAQPSFIGDHLRDDQVAGMQPEAEDYTLTASARLDKICNMLVDTKSIAFGVLCGKDTIATLVAAPSRMRTQAYAGQ